MEDWGVLGNDVSGELLRSSKDELWGARSSGSKPKPECDDVGSDCARNSEGVLERFTSDALGVVERASASPSAAASALSSELNDSGSSVNKHESLIVLNLEKCLDSLLASSDSSSDEAVVEDDEASSQGSAGSLAPTRPLLT